jgi:hypothetical protein|tara:strand:- start:1380 stop:1595 length:216 start_codon:yes stop_codon:yes gene_type:complete
MVARPPAGPADRSRIAIPSRGFIGVFLIDSRHNRLPQLPGLTPFLYIPMMASLHCIVKSDNIVKRASMEGR